MFNALNALSENQSLLRVTPASNPWVLAAIALSMALHLAILYVPFLARVFVVAPLTAAEWWAVVLISAPVVLLDEVLKWMSRRVCAPIALLRRSRALQLEQNVSGGGNDGNDKLIPLAHTQYSVRNMAARLCGPRGGCQWLPAFLSGGGSGDSKRVVDSGTSTAAYMPLSTVDAIGGGAGGATKRK